MSVAVLQRTPSSIFRLHLASILFLGLVLSFSLLLQKLPKSVVSKVLLGSNFIMISIRTQILNTFGALALAVMFFMASTPFASAQTYYYYPTYPQADYSAQIQMLLKQVQALTLQLQAMRATYPSNQGNHYGYANNYYGNYYTGNYDIEVSTEDADIESDDTATLSGEVELDGASYATVWFEYGQDGDLDEDSDSLRVTTDRSFDIEVDDVDTDESYYFRAVAEAPNGERAYGTIRSFGDDDNDDDDNDSNDETPDVTTEDTDNIDEDSARISGEVDMNDFNNGLAFFVYGQDEDMVSDVEDENQYADIDEDGDDLQKVQVASSFDGTRTFWASFSGLDDDTEYFYRMCVQYEDEDGDDVLECGDVESFETDN